MLGLFNFIISVLPPTLMTGAQVLTGHAGDMAQAFADLELAFVTDPCSRLLINWGVSLFVSDFHWYSVCLGAGVFELCVGFFRAFRWCSSEVFQGRSSPKLKTQASGIRASLRLEQANRFESIFVKATTTIPPTHPARRLRAT